MKHIVICFACKQKAILFYSHSYQFVANDTKLWNSVWIELCKHCNTFHEINTRDISIRRYVERYGFAGIQKTLEV